MNSRFPLDSQGMDNIVTEIRANDSAQKEIISSLCQYLKYALEESSGNNSWYEKADELVKDLLTRKTTWENFRFDQGNGHKLNDISPYIGLKEEEEVERYDGEMSEAELAKLFDEPVPVKKEEKPVSKMTLEEIETWEKNQDNNTDIYKISARVKNLATMAAGNNLTNMGIMLTNTYVHVLKALYDFAETIQDKEVKIKLVDLLRSKEGMPADFIAAVGANVKEKS